MRASELVAQMGADLVGLRVMTEAIGDYPGGPATVVELTPDPGAPEIVCQVRHDSWRDIRSDTGQMGIFEHEELSLL